MIIEEIVIHSEKEDIPKEYCYDTETPDFYVYRHKYTGKEIHIVKNPKTYINVQNYINKVLDKIRAEIEILPIAFTSSMEMKKDCLEIIDKYKKESEDKE